MYINISHLLLALYIKSYCKFTPHSKLLDTVIPNSHNIPLCHRLTVNLHTEMPISQKLIRYNTLSRYIST